MDELEAIIVLILLVLMCVKNAFSLIIALRFRRDLKEEAFSCCEGTVVQAAGTVNRSYDSRSLVIAEYTADDRQVRGWMICGCDGRLEVGDTVTVIVPEFTPKVFAFSEEQVKHAVRKYSVMTVALTFITTLIFVVRALG